MSFRLKLMLMMAALVTAVAGVALFVTQRSVQGQYQGLMEARVGDRLGAIRERQSERLAGVFERVRDGLQNPRLAAAFLIEDAGERAERLYADLGAELAPLLSGESARAGTRFRLFDEGNAVVAFPGEVSAAGEVELVSRVSGLIPKVEGGEVRAVSGFVVLGEGVEEVLVHPVVDAFDGTFYGNLVLMMPIASAEEVLGRAGDVRLALRVGDRVVGDGRLGGAGDGDFVEVDGGRVEVVVRELGQEEGFDRVEQVAGFSTAEREEALGDLRRRVAGFGVGAFLVSVGLSYLLAGQVSRPVAALTEGTREILEGKLGGQLEVRGKDELGRLSAAFNAMSEGLAMKEKYRSVLGRVTDPRVAEELTRGELELGGEQREVAVLFCDIRGFTALTEHMAPREVVAMLNAHMTAMTEVVEEHGGVVDKFVGDEVMVIFGAPIGTGRHAEDAVACARAMVARRQEMNREMERGIEIGIGIASGEVLVGCMGSEKRLNYTVLGARVNLAARLCSKAAPMQVMLDSETNAVVSDELAGDGVGVIDLKGFENPPSVYVIRAPLRTRQ